MAKQSAYINAGIAEISVNKKSHGHKNQSHKLTPFKEYYLQGEGILCVKVQLLEICN